MINITDETIQKSLQAIENIAPKAWAMLIEKQKIDAVLSCYGSTAWFAMALAGIVFTNRWLKYLLSTCEDRYIIENKAFCHFIQVCFFSIILGVTYNGIEIYYQYNHPDIYALQKLISK